MGSVRKLEGIQYKTKHVTVNAPAPQPSPRVCQQGHRNSRRYIVAAYRGRAVKQKKKLVHIMHAGKKKKYVWGRQTCFNAYVRGVSNILSTSLPLTCMMCPATKYYCATSVGPKNQYHTTGAFEKNVSSALLATPFAPSKCSNIQHPGLPRDNLTNS